MGQNQRVGRRINFYAATVDVASMTMGPSVREVSGVMTNAYAGAAQYALSADGRLVYIPGGQTDLARFGWVDLAANTSSRSELRIFEDTRELSKIPYPLGRLKRHNAMSFGPDGILVIGLYGGGQTVCDVFLVDQRTKTYSTMFSRNQSRVVSLAVGRKAAWKE